jgi:hypoxanthine phosphoribosyltransferase
MESNIVTWARVERLSNVLWQNLDKKTTAKFHSISTISRGGLVPARLMADIMGINEILVDKNQIPVDSLFVDDIYDSGNTFKKIISKAEDPKSLVYATLFARKGKQYPKQIIFATQTKGTEYVVFPWEKFEHKRLMKIQK